MSPPANLERESWWLFAMAFLMLAAGLGLRDPWPADEPRFTLAAKQMIESGQWWFTQRGIELYSDKPPLFMWLQALLFKLTGQWRVAFLLPSLIASILSLWLCFDLSKRLHGERAARYAVGAMLLCFQFMYQMKRAQIDPVLFGFTTVSAYGLLRHTLLGPHWRWYWAGWFFAGVGIITKGVGFLPLLLLLWVWPLRRWQWQGMGDFSNGPARNWQWWAGWLFLFLPIILWLVPMAMQAYGGNDPRLRAYADDLLFRQTGERLVNAWHHHHPPYYFLQVIATTWLPMSLALIWLVPAWARAWQARDARVWLPLGGFLLILLFFTLSTGKRDMYILPALPLLVWAAAPFFQSIIDNRNARRLALGFALAFALLLTSAGIAAVVGEPTFELKLEAERQLGDDRLWWALVGIGVAGLIASLILRRRAMHALLAVMAVLWIGYGFMLTPLMNDANSGRALMTQVETRIGANAEWAMLGWQEQHLLQAKRQPTVFGFKRDRTAQRNDALRWLHAKPGRWLFANRSWLAECESKTQPWSDFSATRGRRWVLLQADAIALDRCGVGVSVADEPADRSD